MMTPHAEGSYARRLAENETHQDENNVDGESPPAATTIEERIRKPLETESPTDVDTRSELRLMVMTISTSTRHTQTYGTNERTILPNSATIGGGTSSGNGTSRAPAWPIVGSTFASARLLATEAWEANGGVSALIGGAGGESEYLCCSCASFGDSNVCRLSYTGCSTRKIQATCIH